MNTYTSRDDECLAYLSALVTLELCSEVHRNGRPNTAIRQCCTRLLPRLTQYPRVFAIFTGLQRQALPVGCLHHIRRMLEEMIDGTIGYEEEPSKEKGL